MVQKAYHYDFWISGKTDLTVELSCLMPNGIFIPLEANRNATLLEIKEDLWEESTKFPLHRLLLDSSTYVFSCINSMSENEELVDEHRRLCDVKPFCSLLKVIERKGNKVENLLNIQIGYLIGKGLHEFNSLKCPEVGYFRSRMKYLSDEMARQRQSKTWLEKLYYQYPPRLSENVALSSGIHSKLNEGHFILSIRFDNNDASFTFNVCHTTKPLELLHQIIKKKTKALNSQGERPEDLILKVCGQEEYLVGDYPLIEFTYIQESLNRDQMPALVVVSHDSLQIDEDNEYDCVEDIESRPRLSFSTLTLRKKMKHILSWDKENEPYRITINSISRLNCDTNRIVELGVQVGLFHGGKSLTEPKKTSDRQMTKDCECFWDEQLEFDLTVQNIPRMARLCLVVYEISKTAKGVKSRKLKDSKQDLYLNPLAWVNTTIYDFKEQLKTGEVKLCMWTYAEDTQSDDLLHPLGTTASNPISDATSITITFEKFDTERTVMYPSKERVVEYALASNPKLALAFSNLNRGNSPHSPLNSQMNIYIEHLKKMAMSETELHEQERKVIWGIRYDCLYHVPELLSKILDCVEWNDHKEVAEVTALLEKWPKLPLEKALELLDYAYADQTVRSFAVQCLQDVSDEDLSLYLLQLVQAIKHESYLYCDLVVFLLERALNNQKIGHYLFWHLRSEMNVPSVSIRFGLILEAYCRGSKEHMRSLSRQVELLNNLQLTSKHVRQRRDKDKAKLYLQESLEQKPYQESISKVLNPLDPSFRFSLIKFDKCRVLDSKMRPLWLVLQNDDPFGDDIYLIFKSGDDLRQDMLTLQMIRIMDKLWKNEGLDLRMNPYGCISTDYRVGLIEVVLNAETIANIQKNKGIFSATSAFKKGSLLAWLKDYNTNENTLNKAIEEFTLSCAGYCVATYVLGIADRHSDNIMVKTSGQLFHIDFGHILGHFKEKFGFRRERVPFVLTHDFVHVINKGQTRKEALEFQIFQSYCEQAFTILRRHAGLILSLFAMMISTGLPELSSEKDLNYLRETLVPELTDEEALSHFRSKFDEALCNSWKTSLNWASHNMSKNTKQ